MTLATIWFLVLLSLNVTLADHSHSRFGDLFRGALVNGLSAQELDRFRKLYFFPIAYRKYAPSFVPLYGSPKNLKEERNLRQAIFDRLDAVADWVLENYSRELSGYTKNMEYVKEGVTEHIPREYLRELYRYAIKIRPVKF